MAVTKRTRLSPHDRRMQLLDSAQHLIQTQGLSSFTMEALAKQAGVSNPLIYKYFDTRLALLQELLQRELLRFYANIKQRLEQANDYPEVVRIVVAVNFDEAAKGNVLTMLRNQPDIQQALHKLENKESRRLARFLINSLADHFQLDKSQAEELTVFASGASLAAAEHYGRYGGNKEMLIQNTSRFIFGGIESFLK